MNDFKVIHVSAWGRTFTQFRMPLLRKLREKGAEQLIYCPDEHEHVVRLIEEGYKVRIANVSSKFGASVMPQIFSLYRYIKRKKFSVLIAHQPMGALVGIPAAYLAGIPTRIYSTGGLKFNTDYKGFINTLLKLGELKIIEMSDAVFLVNREDEEILKKRNSRVKEKAYYVGPKGGCGVDINRFNPRNRLERRNHARKEIGIPDDSFLIGYIGRCVWEKGFKEIIDSAALIKKKASKIKFLILGEGQHLEEIKKYAVHKNVAECFLFLGYKFDIDFYMAAMDAFILPSYREGLPISLLEAMTYGIPSIATDIRGNRELITDRKSGILIPVKNSFKLAEAIIFLKNNPAEASAMAIDGYEYICRNYVEAVLSDKTTKIILDISSKMGKDD